ncbi:MAG: TrbI/VirB10 family protein [Candidatus Acidiferrum sp.]
MQMSNDREPTVQGEPPLQKPINGFRYIAYALIGLFALLMVVNISRCGKSSQAIPKSAQSLPPSIARPVTLSQFGENQEGDAARLRQQATSTKGALVAAKAAYDAMYGQLPCDPTLAGTRGIAANGTQSVCGADGLWRPITAPVSMQDAGTANPAADARARQKQSAVDNARQAKEREEARKLAALQSSTIAIDFTDHASAEVAKVGAPPIPTVAHELKAAEPRDAVKPVKYEWNQYAGKTYKIPEGTVFETVLTNRINGSASGPINTMFTTDIWSHDHQHLLIPQGTRCLGTVSGVNSGTQQRLYVAFHRCIMPDLYSLDLDKFAGLNQIGEVGLRDQVNHHYLQIFGASLAVGAVAGMAQIGNSYGGFGYDPGVAIRNGVSQQMAQESIHVLDRFLNQLPTFTIRERSRVKIYLTADLDVPSYDAHRVDPAL